MQKTLLLFSEFFLTNEPSSNNAVRGEVGWIHMFDASDARAKKRNYFPNNPTIMIVTV